MTRQALTAPVPPPDLGSAGLALWQELTASSAAGEVIVFERAELVVLRMACASADSIAELQDAISADGVIVPGSKGQPKLSGAVAELRLQRAALARLVGMVAVPADGEQVGKSPTQRKAQRAADARWAKQAAQRRARSG